MFIIVLENPVDLLTKSFMDVKSKFESTKVFGIVLISKVGELQMLGYNPKQSPCGIVSRWKADELVDNAQLIFVANSENGEEQNYAKFVNQIEQAMRLFATELEIPTEKDELTLRFHQHVAYNLPADN